MRAEEKVVVIGVDGASPEIIQSLSTKGLMPNFRRLISSGARARLQSTIPPHSGPAWTSAITGKNPGKHGVFFFTTVNPSRTGERLVSSRDIRTSTLFDLVGRQGMKSIALNVPLTYPPWEIEGVLVSGIFAPSTSDQYTFPPELGAELARRGYEVEFSAWDDYDIAKKELSKSGEDAELGRMRQRYLDRAVELDQKNIGTLLYLMQRDHWDLAMVVLPGLDRVQHILWRPLAPEEEHPEGMEHGCSRYVIEAYCKIDAMIGQVLEGMDGKTWVIVISDHGFGSISRIFYVNRWLESELLLYRREQKARGFASRLMGSRFGQGRSAAPQDSKPARTADSLAFHGLLPTYSFDMSRTVAYAPTPYGLVNVNSRPDEQRGKILDGFRSRIENIRDPKTGRFVIRKAHISSEIYKGPFQEEASDVLLEPDPDYYIANGLESSGIITDAIRYPGAHKPDGILLVSGPGAKQGYELPRAHIYDVSPTILRILGVPIPKDMDGITLDDTFKDGSRVLSQSIIYSETSEIKHDISASIRELKGRGKL